MDRLNDREDEEWEEYGGMNIINPNDQVEEHEGTTIDTDDE